jgi:hypothetical protein
MKSPEKKKNARNPLAGGQSFLHNRCRHFGVSVRKKIAKAADATSRKNITYEGRLVFFPK